MTIITVIPTDFGGIVFVLICNLGASLFLLLLFGFLRNKIKRKSGIHQPLLSESIDLPQGVNDGKEEVDSIDEKTGSHTSNLDLIRKSTSDVEVEVGESFFGWIPKTLRLSDKAVVEMAGRDSLVYLQFEKRIVLFLGICSLMGLAIWVPVNITGENKLGGFSATTVYNLAKNSPRMWAIVALSSLISAISFYFIFVARNFHSHAKAKYHSFKPPKPMRSSLMPLSVCIINFPKEVTDNEELLKAMEKMYPGRLLEAQIAMDLRDMSVLLNEKEKVEKKLSQLKIYYDSVQNPDVSFDGTSAEAREHYSKKLEELNEKMNTWKATEMRKKGSRFAFVTFKTRIDATRCIVDARSGKFANLSKFLHSSSWTVVAAPNPTDILWDNLPIGGMEHQFRMAVSNSVIITFLSLVTGIAAMLSVLNDLNEFDPLRNLVVGFLRNPRGFGEHCIYHVVFSLIPALFMWMISAGMPYVFAGATRFEKHYLRSQEEHWIMRKTFVYLFCFVLIVPSLTITMVDALVEVVKDHMTFLDTLQHFFLADSGQFFLNYVITIGLLGNSLELLRVSKFMKQAWKKLWMNKSRTYIAPLKNSRFEFGIQYSWMLNSFAVILIFSCFTPLILPAGFFHFSFKYFVDKHNLCFSCAKSGTSSGKLFHTALSYVVVSTVAFLLSLCVFFLLREDWLFAGLVAAVTLITVVVYFWLEYRKKRFLKKQQRRIGEIYGNAASVEAQAEIQEAKLASMVFLKGGYAHPILQTLVDEIPYVVK